MATVSTRGTVGLVTLFMAGIITTSAPGFLTAVWADKAAAFFGGMLTDHVVGGAIRRSRMRTAATMQMAHQRPQAQPVYMQQPAMAPAVQPHAMTPPTAAPAGQPSVEARLNELNKLAAGGYITPQEYKAKKQAILNSL